MRHAGFWRRFAAFWFDILRVTAAVTAVFYLFFGFDAAVERYRASRRGDIDARAEFLAARNRVCDSAAAVYFVYCGLLESSALRGSLGKRLAGIQVVNADGSPLTFGQSVRRNGLKTLSFLPLGLGCLWVAWSKDKRAWHDRLAGTVVVLRSPEATI